MTVLGAGLMGRLLAWRWARSGACVTVLERSAAAAPASAAHTAAAMIAPYSERAVADEQVFQRGLRSLTLWPELLAQLHNDTGEHIAYGAAGTLLVAHRADHALLQQCRQTFRHYGVEAARWLDAQQLQQLEPDLNGFSSGCWVSDEAHLDNRALLPALQRAAERFGAQYRFDSDVQMSNGQYQLHGQPLKADMLIDCRGTGARDWPHGERPRAVRGEVCWIESTEVFLTRPVRLLHPRYSLYLVPKPSPPGRQRYILGATEIETADSSPVSVRSALEMLSALYSLNPKLAEARVLQLDVNLRPAYADHIARFEQRHGALCVNGLFRHGYLQAPALLEEMQQQLNWPLQWPSSVQESLA
ncbi:NAD(P)/FAD-dependent oxidoreductase [Bacterioplanes sanyensis]|uniref:NAD(P)/FAD-dependent oxidoreductase n=1 Tax=Bacterioplanes sanyensis TaxID=1249553 RepID=UPI0022B8B744|nr:FAD-dependent oxidoreductase [Bacterioplanes sanyensis]